MNPSESIEAFSKAIELIKHAKISSDQKKKSTVELEDNMAATKFGTYCQNSNQNKVEKSLDIIEEHIEIQGSTNKLGVEFSDIKGRHAVAKETIEPGEVICKAKPIASIILFADSMEFCYNCLDHVISPIPCTKCSAIVFCSFSCLESSKLRHSYDCSLSLMDIFLSSQGTWVSKILP